MRLFLGFAIVAVAAAAAAWLVDRPGVVVLDWQGYRIESSLAVVLAALVLVMAAAAVLYQFWRWLRRGPMIAGRARADRRRVRGQLALTQGMVAVAAGDKAAALRFGRQAELLIAESPLTMLLSAQAAQLNGDDLAARRYFAAMLERPEMEFLGLRGLIAQATRDGQTGSALNLARRAFTLRPDAPWLVTALFDLEARAGNWAEAGRVIDHALRNKLVAPENGQQRKAVALYQMARTMRESDRGTVARKLALESLSLDPGLVPAAAFAADLLLAQGKRRRALHLIEQTWALQPHPDLGAVYEAALADEPAPRRLARVEKLAGLRADDRHSRLMLARAALAAGEFDSARAALEPLTADDPDAETCRIMADLEERARGPAYARAWLTRIEAAPSGPGWVCEVCDHGVADWSAYCDNCQSFDSLRWGRLNGGTRIARNGAADAASTSGRTESLPPAQGAAPPPPPPDAASVPVDGPERAG